MLQINRSPLLNSEAKQEASATYVNFVAFLRRQFPIIASSTAILIILGLIYVMTAPPGYTAQATMIIDTRKISLFQQQSIVGDIPVDSATVESQVEVLRSENIALAVIKDLHLTEEPEFVSSGGGLVGSLFGGIGRLVGFTPQRSEFELRRRAAEAFASRLNVKRVGLTYIIEVSFRSTDPDRAARIANSVIETYIVDQLDAKFRATQRASGWLQERIRELREQASTAERAVVDYKTKNNIVDAGGRLISDQQLGEVNTQLSQAREKTSEARARLDRIDEIIRAEVPDASVTDSLRSEIITKLRQQYLDLKAREADWSVRYGRQHLAAVNLRNQMAEIRKSMLDELRRIAESAKSDFEIAKQREQSIEQTMSGAVARSQVTNQAQVTLRELESTAQSYRSLYDNFLQRYMESVQQQSFPITEARVITSATPPLVKSHPKTTPILLLCAFFGLGLGIAVGRVRDMLDRTFRSGRQLEQQLSVNCLAVLPMLKLSETIENDASESGGKTLMREVESAPFSGYSEGIRSIKVAIDLNGRREGCKVLGVTSVLPGEGKSTTAGSLALLMAQSGARTLLIDGDLRNPSLSRLLSPKASVGLLEVAGGLRRLDDVRQVDPTTGLHFLPAVLPAHTAHTSEILAGDVMKHLFDFLRLHYDYIVFDLSPLAPVVDVRRTTHLVDSYLLVVEWGRTRIETVEHAMSDAPNVFEGLVGVVLNKSNTRVLGRYDSYAKGYYHKRYYSQYNYGGRSA